MGQQMDGRKDGLSTQGYPLREIVSRQGGIHVLECGHQRTAPRSGYGPVRTRRCVECSNDKEAYTKAELVAAKRDLAEKVLAAIAAIEAEEVSRFGEGAKGISAKVRELFTNEGIARDATTQKEKGE
jgi:hypothetical protein